MICPGETRATTSPLTSAQGPWTKVQFDMHAKQDHVFFLSPTVLRICSKYPKLRQFAILKMQTYFGHLPTARPTAPEVT